MDLVPHENVLAYASHIDETPATVRHPPGDAGGASGSLIGNAKPLACVSPVLAWIFNMS